MEQKIDRELTRARRLMAAEVHGLEVVEGEPQPASPTDLGALAGVAFRTLDPEVIANVYLFETQAQHGNAILQLEAQVAAAGVTALFSSNGALLFFGHTRIDGSNGDPLVAAERLDQLAAALAGEE